MSASGRYGTASNDLRAAIASLQNVADIDRIGGLALLVDRLHRVCDVDYDEDRCTIRTAPYPEYVRGATRFGAHLVPRCWVNLIREINSARQITAAQFMSEVCDAHVEGCPLPDITIEGGWHKYTRVTPSEAVRRGHAGAKGDASPLTFRLFYDRTAPTVLVRQSANTGLLSGYPRNRHPHPRDHFCLRTVLMLAAAQNKFQ